MFGGDIDDQAQRDQFHYDRATLRLLERWVYPDCENCGHRWYDHRSEGILPLPAVCISDCACTSPAHIVHRRYMDDALKEAFGENSRTQD